MRKPESFPVPPFEIRHVVMFSGGICSFCAAERVIKANGVDGVILLFADTKIEDADLYRFLNESSSVLNVPLIRIADGRTPWDVFRDQKFISNDRIDQCSRELKRDLLARWKKRYTNPRTCLIHFGLDWTESHRIERLSEFQAPWQCRCPMIYEPYLSKKDMCLIAENEYGIKRPRLYALQYPHNNCGGFCVKSGQAQFKHLLETQPDVYAFHEEQEALTIKVIEDYCLANGKPIRPHRIISQIRNGERHYMTLKEFRESLQSRDCDIFFDRHEWGGCGCAVE